VFGKALLNNYFSNFSASTNASDIMFLGPKACDFHSVYDLLHEKSHLDDSHLHVGTQGLELFSLHSGRGFIYRGDGGEGGGGSTPASPQMFV
jgi:hypothetical protein